MLNINGIYSQNMQQEQVTLVRNFFVSGMIHYKGVGLFKKVIFVSNDLDGFTYEGERGSPCVFKNGKRLTIENVQEVINEMQQLLEIMEARKLIEELAEQETKQD